MSWTVWLVALLVTPTIAAQTVIGPAPQPSPEAPPAAVGAPLERLLELVVREQFREDFVDDDDWGKTRRVVNGHKIKGKPFEWRVRPNMANVKDGLWEKYAVRLRNPDERLHVEITELVWRNGRLAYTVNLMADVRGDARWERWRRGFKMLNAHVVADATVAVQLSGEVRFEFLTGADFPGVAVEPRFTALDIQLREFDLQQVSKLDGIAAHELGEGMKPQLQRELNRREEKIVAKLNRSLEKRYDQLRFSPQAFVASGWSKLQDSLQ
jgi:hypothetical protein